MYRKILVPLDGSPFGEHALPLALAIARHTGAKIEVVHVHVLPTPLATGKFVFDRPADAALRHEEDYLADVARRAADTAGIQVKTTNLLSGPVSEELAGRFQVAADNLVIMATHGRGGLARLWLGSVSDRLIGLMDAPMLLVHPPEGMPHLNAGVVPRRILVALDGSASSEGILRPAAELGRLIGADLLLVRAIEPKVAEYHLPDGAARLWGESLLIHVDEQETEAQRAAEAYLEGIAQRLRTEGLTVRTHVVSSKSPAVAILDQVRAGMADLIALATHGRHGITRFFLDSVADKIMRGAVVPVLVQRQRAAAAGSAGPTA